MRSRVTTIARRHLVSAAAVWATVLVFGAALVTERSGMSATIAAPLSGNAKPRKPLKVGHPTFASPHASPIAVHGDDVFVVNTPADTVDVIDRETQKARTRINVGIDPVSIAVRPDGKEIWVSNHVSDSVSVIDNDSESPTCLQIVATIQEFNAESKATTFDEPVGIAFAGNEKAYVALSSENQIAVIDVASRAITKRLRIPAQDPRAIAVHGDRLFVVPFESNNRTQLSDSARDDIDGDLDRLEQKRPKMVELLRSHVSEIKK